MRDPVGRCSPEAHDHERNGQYRENILGGHIQSLRRRLATSTRDAGFFLGEISATWIAWSVCTIIGLDATLRQRSRRGDHRHQPQEIDIVTFTPRTVGRYRLHRPLGQGGMGSLYVAQDHMDRLVAVKLLHGNMDRERFGREARAMAALQHKNIVHIYDYGEHEGTPFTVMEYLRGESLSELIRRRAPLPVATKLKMIEELCEGLTEAHNAGIIHRDIKPANLMWARNTLKILDFGIARVAGAETRISARGILGTSGYLSPEQIRGGTLDSRADLFAVGAVFYELLSYTPAFYRGGETEHTTMNRILNEDPEPLGSLCPDLDPAVADLVDRALAKHLRERYQDAETLRRDISALREQVTAVHPVAQSLGVEAADPTTDAALRERLTDVEARLDRNELTPAEEILTQLSTRRGRSPRIDALWARLNGRRRDLEKNGLAQTAAESACRRAEQAMAEGAFTVALRHADEALVHLPDHPTALRLRKEAQTAQEASSSGVDSPLPQPTELAPTPTPMRGARSASARGRLLGVVAGLAALAGIGYGLGLFLESQSPAPFTDSAPLEPGDSQTGPVENGPIDNGPIETERAITDPESLRHADDGGTSEARDLGMGRRPGRLSCSTRAVAWRRCRLGRNGRGPPRARPVGIATGGLVCGTQCV